MKTLDINADVKTSYCISDDQRDAQMRLAMARIKGRVEPREDVQDEEIAVVCFGPSLKDTWEEVKNFKTIITCSGAHKFLVDRGIIPTIHIDCDPRAHKAKLIGTPQKETQYMMASCIHPEVLDLLEGFDVKLWHIYANENYKELPLVYPRGEWILTGGCNIGLRALVMARFLGWTKLHVFGMDCSFPEGKVHHADTHPNGSSKIFKVPFEGKDYYCEPVMVEYARQFFHEMEKLPDVKVKLHGIGLLQHMVYKKMSDFMPSSKREIIAFATPRTITPSSVEANKKLHENPIYGIDGKKHKDVVEKLAKSLNTTSVMDYGCGKGTLANSLPFPIWEYDPAIPGKDEPPRPADLVICTNVLECVEDEMLDAVLGDLVRCTKLSAYIVMEKQKPKEFWESKLNEYFIIGKIIETEKELHCALGPRKLGPIKQAA